MRDDAELAEAARACLLAGIRAADARALTARALAEWTPAGTLPNVRVIAVGKAAATMLAGAHEALGSAIIDGVAIVPAGAGPLPHAITPYVGGHPMPNEEGARGAAACARIARDSGPEVRLLVLISGGASALMTLPAAEVSLESVLATSRALMQAGAGIGELNCVRKHVDQLKGGLLARAVGGAPVHTLVLSDVIGDPLDVIGSGVLSADPTTYLDAIGVLKARGIWETTPRDVRGHLGRGARGELPETPKEGDACFANVEIEVIGNNALAVNGAAAEAQSRGFSVSIMDVPVEGEARDAGTAFVRRALTLGRDVGQRGTPPACCLIGGGETTVTVTGSGIGGRNLEFASAAAIAIEGEHGVVVGSIGTDGRDGPTDAAGAVVNGATASRARAAELDLAGALRVNDTLRALDATGAVIRTGPTGTNVMDLCIALVTRA